MSASESAPVSCARSERCSAGGPPCNDALSSVFGDGLLDDLQEATWDDETLRQRGINPKAVSDVLREQARELT